METSLPYMECVHVNDVFAYSTDCVCVNNRRWVAI